jgi:preprotein translocase subunit SecG
MESYILLVIAVAVLLILVVLWQQRTHRASNRTTGEISNPPHQPARARPSENEPLG